MPAAPFADTAERVTLDAQEVQLHFIGVGAAKCGTSWLSVCLRQHPEVCMAEPKELNYFCEKAIWEEFRVNHGLGPKWLARRFVHRKPGQYLGEFSPCYLNDPSSPRLIFEHNPDCRLIFMFRHPVEMLISYYCQVAKEAPVPGDFAEFLQKYPHMPAIALYYEQLQRFLKLFPREQCLILLYDDIETNPAAVVRECFSFLGVNDAFVPSILQARLNERKAVRFRALMMSMYWIKCRVHTSNRFLQMLIWRLQLYRVHRWFWQRNLMPAASVAVSQHTRRQLLDFYREDTRALASFLGRDLSHWES